MFDAYVCLLLLLGKLSRYKISQIWRTLRPRSINISQLLQGLRFIGFSKQLSIVLVCAYWWNWLHLDRSVRINVLELLPGLDQTHLKSIWFLALLETRVRNWVLLGVSVLFESWQTSFLLEWGVVCLRSTELSDLRRHTFKYRFICWERLSVLASWLGLDSLLQLELSNLLYRLGFVLHEVVLKLLFAALHFF